MFKDRQDAGRKLASALLHYRGQEVVAIGLPRGGIPVAAEVAKALSAPMTMIFVRKIGVPTSPEVAMGAVVDGAHPYVFKNGDVIRQAGISEAVFQSAMNAELKEIERRKAIFGTVLPHIDIEGKTVILVDDGIATGATMKAAAMAIEQYGVRRVGVAVPVSPKEVIVDFEERIVEEVICLEPTSSFGAVGCFYLDFGQLSDDDVIACFRQLAAAER